MDDKRKNIFISSGAIFLVGILIFGNSLFTQTSNYQAHLIGFVITVIGVLGLKFPDSIGEILDYWTSGKYGERTTEKINQHQNKPNKSPQIYAPNSTNYFNYDGEDKSKRK